MVPASRGAGPLESKASALERQAKAEVTSIRDQVFSGWHRALVEDPGLRRRLGPVGWLLRSIPVEQLYAPFDYVLAVGRRQGSATFD